MWQIQQFWGQVVVVRVRGVEIHWDAEQGHAGSVGCSCRSSWCRTLQPHCSGLLILIGGCCSLSPCAFVRVPQQKLGKGLEHKRDGSG